MFIRQTRTANTSTGEAYFTFRLVRGERVGGRVRQITLLNLGRHFPIKQSDWPTLCARIEQLLYPQQAQLIATPCADALERAAQRYVGQLIARADPLPADDASDPSSRASAASARASTGAGEATPAVATPAVYVPDIQEVDIDSLQFTQPRTVGVEHVALHAIAQLGLIEKLTGLGVNGVQCAAILGNLIGRMAHPASELSTHAWLQTHSALGELLDVDFASMSHMAPCPI